MSERTHSKQTPSRANQPEADIRPFRIQVPQADLDDLRYRLAHTRWPGEIEGVGWDYGADLSYMKELVDYWLKRKTRCS